jgi:transposase
MVRLRTAAVNAVVDWPKPAAIGCRLPRHGVFAKRGLATMPPELARAVAPVLEQMTQMTLKIKHYDRQILELTQTEYPETQALLKVQGVGHITALTFVLTLGNKQRLKRSRDVGCYLGLRPRRSQSGDRDPQLGITRAGNVYTAAAGASQGSYTSANRRPVQRLVMFASRRIAPVGGSGHWRSLPS